MGYFLGEEEQRTRPGPAGDLVRLGPGSWGDRGRQGGAWDSGGGSPGRDGVAPGGTPWPLPCPEGCGPPGAGSGARPLPRSGSYGSGACSRRRLRCQQTPGASLPGPPLSNSEPVSPKSPAANASGGGRFRGPEAAPLPGPGPVCRGRREQVPPNPGGKRAPRGLSLASGGSARVTPGSGPALSCGSPDPRQWFRAGLTPPSPVSTDVSRSSSPTSSALSNTSPGAPQVTHTHTSKRSHRRPP